MARAKAAKPQRARAPAAASSTERGRSTTVKSLGQSPARSVAQASEPSKPLTRKAMKTASIEPPAKRADADDALTVATLKRDKKDKKVEKKKTEVRVRVNMFSVRVGVGIVVGFIIIVVSSASTDCKGKQGRWLRRGSFVFLRE